MTKMLSTLAAVFTLNTAAFAAEVDTQKSTFTWKGTKITGDYHDGQIEPESSSLKVVDGKVVSGEVVLRMDSITVGNLEGQWKDKFIGHMKSADFFDVASFPTATLKLSTVKNGTAAGELTVKGVTKPVSFPVKHADGKYTGTLTFDRTKFGITFGSGSFFEDLGDKLINDEVEVAFSLALKGQ